MTTSTNTKRRLLRRSVEAALAVLLIAAGLPRAHAAALPDRAITVGTN